MDNDVWGRTISVSTADSIDSYTVYQSDNSSTFSIPFPEGTDLTYVYKIINSIYPSNGDVGFPGATLADTYSATGWPAGDTQMRPLCATWYGNPSGFMYFDQTLNKPIWFVGWGPTGWIDATGAQV